MEDWDDLTVKREDRRLRALVADDDEGIRRLLKAVLELDGWDVEVAGDGDEAVAKTASFHPDAVILDVMMPNTDGVTALKRIRDDEANRDVAVVMVSALNDADVVAEATDAGADDYIVKPVMVDQVSDRVLRLVQGIETGSHRK